MDTREMSKGLVGTWWVAGTTPAQGTFPGLMTFMADGMLITSESPHLFESSAHGAWAARDPGGVAYTFVGLLGNAEGKNTGRIKVVGALQSGSEPGTWVGPFRVEVFDAADQVVFADRGSFSLTRISVEALI